MKLTSRDYLDLEWNILNSSKVETVNTKVNYRVPTLVSKLGTGTPSATRTKVFRSEGFFQYPYENHESGPIYDCVITTEYYTATGTITLTFDQPISGNPIVAFSYFGPKYKTLTNNVAVTVTSFMDSGMELLPYLKSIVSGSGSTSGYDLREKATPHDMLYEQTDMTVETKTPAGTVNYYTADITQKRLNDLGTPTKNQYYKDLEGHRWNYDGNNWIDEKDGVLPCSLVRFWSGFNNVGTKFVGTKLNTWRDVHVYSAYGYGQEYITETYEAGDRPYVDFADYTYTYIGSKTIVINYKLLTDALVWVTTDEEASRNFMRVWFNDVVSLSVKMENETIEFAFSLDGTGALTHTATNRYPLSIDTSNLVDEETLIGTEEWDHAVAKNVLDAFEGGRYMSTAKVSVYWVRDNNVTIDSVTQIVLLNGKYISRKGVVCNFKVTSIEGVFEQGQFYYNIALLEE